MVDRAALGDYFMALHVANPMHGANAPVDPIALRAEEEFRGRHILPHPDDYNNMASLLVPCRVDFVASVVDQSGCEFVMFVPTYYEFQTDSRGRFVRDTRGVRGCGVPTEGFLLEYWDTQLDGNAPLPVHLIRRLPNVVHYCNTSCTVKADKCEHEIYAGTNVLKRAFERMCKCKASVKDSRLVHSLGGAAGDVWLLGEVELSGKGRVRWDARH
jgi:hypothetical protein